ncbi:MAG: hypothetical protein AAGJ46_08480 [Planctomycetota bacterium]
MIGTCVAAAAAIGLCVNQAAHGQAPTATTQIVDFRVADGVWEKGETEFGNFGPEFETFDIATRPVNAFSGTELEGLASQFSGLSQNADGNVQGNDRPEQADFEVETFFNSTSIRNFSRFGQDISLPNGRAGTLQWNFDLTSLDTYLSNNGLNLDALELNMNASYPTGQGREYDLLLSYTSASEGLTLTDISTEVGTTQGSFPGSEDNFAILLRGSRNANLGDLIGDDPRTSFDSTGDFNNDGSVDAADFTVWRDTLNDIVTPGTGADADESGVIDLGDHQAWAANFGASTADDVIEPNTHKVVAKDVGGGIFDGSQNLTTIDLLQLYNDGVREFNLVAITAGFGPNRVFGIQGPDFNDPNNLGVPLSFGSGVYINTSGGVAAAPEPSTTLLAGCGVLAATGCRRRRRG